MGQSASLTSSRRRFTRAGATACVGPASHPLRLLIFGVPDPESDTSSAMMQMWLLMRM